MPEMRRSDKNNPNKGKEETQDMNKLAAGKRRFIKRKLSGERPTV